jgi:hypothetical protein
MRLVRFLREDGEGSGGEGMAEVGNGTTTNDITPFYNKIMSKPVRRVDKGWKKKKKKKDVNEEYLDDNMLQDLVDALDYGRLNEAMIPDNLFNPIKSAASKVGFKVKRSDSIFDYLVSAGVEIQELFSLLCQYVVSEKENKSSLKAQIKTALGKINHRRITAFVLMLDKMTFGLTSIIRHILMYVFGIEITTYNKWENDINYILNHLNKVKKVLMNMSPTEEEIIAFDKLYNVIMKTKVEIEQAKGMKPQ